MQTEPSPRSQSSGPAPKSFFNPDISAKMNQGAQEAMMVESGLSNLATERQQFELGKKLRIIDTVGALMQVLESRTLAGFP